MSYLAVLEAVRARLEGNSPKYVPPFPGSERLKLWEAENPERASAIKNGSAKVAARYTSSTNAKINLGGLKTATEVPIFLFNQEGNYSSQIYPCFTYEVIDFTPRYEEYVQTDLEAGSEFYTREIMTSAEEVVDADGTSLGSSPRLVEKRLVEHPFDILVEIRAFAKDPIMSAEMTSYVYDRFVPRGYIRVPQKDGSYRSWDMLYSSFSDLDRRAAVQEGTPGVTREYAKAWTYKVEGYLDNTDQTVLVHRNRSRSLGLEKV